MMSKIAFLSSAAIAVSVLAAPAMAQHGAVHQGYYPRAYCSHEPGNPYAPEEDYMAWSGWRARGGWDDRPDPNCVQRWHRHGPGY
jgi:hypothetical protein